MQNHTVVLLDKFVDELSDTISVSVIKRELEVPFGHAASKGHLDARLHVSLPGGQAVELAIEVMRTAYPRDVRQAGLTLVAYVASRPTSPVPLALCVVADYLSPGSREELRQAGINYFDSTGSMHFRHDTYLVVKEIDSRHVSPRRPTKLFSGARERLVHALLEHWRRNHAAEAALDLPSGAELAERAQTSTYTVSFTLQELERHDWVETMGRGPGQRKRLRDPAGLLDAWAAAWTGRRESVTRWHVYSAKPDPTDMLLHGLADKDGWALTGAAAANAVVPHLTNVDRVQVIVPPGVSENWGRALKFKPVDKGANVVFIEREGASLMFLDTHPERPRSRFASRFIQYLDLLDNYGRNNELAEQFRRQALNLDTARSV